MSKEPFVEWNVSMDVKGSLIMDGNTESLCFLRCTMPDQLYLVLRHSGEVSSSGFMTGVVSVSVSPHSSLQSTIK